MKLITKFSKKYWLANPPLVYELGCYIYYLIFFRSLVFLEVRKTNFILNVLYFQKTIPYIQKKNRNKNIQ